MLNNTGCSGVTTRGKTSSSNCGTSTYSMTSAAHKTTMIDLPEESFFVHFMLSDVTAQTTLQYTFFFVLCRAVVTAVFSFTSSQHRSWLWSRPCVRAGSCRLQQARAGSNRLVQAPTGSNIIELSSSRLQPDDAAIVWTVGSVWQY